MPLTIRELLALYVAGDDDVSALPRPRPYRDFLSWLHRRDPADSRVAWATALAGVDGPTLLLPDARGRPLSASPESARFTVSEELTADLTALARTRNTTLNTVTQVAWGIVLGAATSRHDVTFGSTVSGRSPHLSGVESMIGLFVNTVPTRITLNPRETLGRLLDRTQAEQAALLDHHHLGLADIQRAAGPDIGFDTATVFESYPIDRGRPDRRHRPRRHPGGRRERRRRHALSAERRLLGGHAAALDVSLPTRPRRPGHRRRDGRPGHPGARGDGLRSG